MDKQDQLDKIYLGFQNVFAKVPKDRIEQNRIVPVGKEPTSSKSSCLRLFQKVKLDLMKGPCMDWKLGKGKSRN